MKGRENEDLEVVIEINSFKKLAVKGSRQSSNWERLGQKMAL